MTLLRSFLGTKDPDPYFYWIRITQKDRIRIRNTYGVVSMYCAVQCFSMH